MALFDFLKPVLQPLGKVAGEVGGYLSGVRERTMKPETWEPLVQDLRDILPYAAAWGIDDPRLPEMALKMRQQRGLAKQKTAQTELSTMKTFFNRQQLSVVPGTEAQLQGLLKKYPTNAQQVIDIGTKSGWLRPTPVPESVVIQKDLQVLAGEYALQTPEKLRELYKVETNITKLNAMKKAATAKGIKLVEKEEKIERPSLAIAVKEELSLFTDLDEAYETENTRAVRLMVIDKRAGKPVGELQQVLAPKVRPWMSDKYILKYVPKGTRTVKDLIGKQKISPNAPVEVEATIQKAISAAKKAGWAKEAIRDIIVEKGRNPELYGY